jgi:hypothetical protein
MLNLYLKIIYIIFLTISSILFIYYIKLYATDNKLIYLFLSILNTFIMLFISYKLFQNNNVSLLLMTIFIKVIPILLLIMIDTLIFKTKITFKKGLGIFIVILGILLIENIRLPYLEKV